MDFNSERWVAEFERLWKEKPIEYMDSSGEWRNDSDPLFGSISSAIESRGYQITKDELLKISQWKLEGRRNDANISENPNGFVQNHTQSALTETDNDEKAVDELMEIKGVGVPMASTVLTVAKPEDYAIIDYRAFRGLVAAKPELVKSEGYSGYAEFLEHFRNYLKNSKAYGFYIEQVREIARAENLSAREVDMALWAFDKERA